MKGGISRQPLPTETELKNYYEQYHRQLKEKFDRRRERKRLEAIKRFTGSGRLLDVGAGRGYFVKAVNQEGSFRAEGVELSSRACRNNPKVRAGDWLSLKFTGKTYDVVTFHSTLEHFRDPDAAIAKAVKVLKPGGLVVFSVPNLDSFEYWLSRWTPYPYAGFIPEHLHYFNHRLVRRLLTRHHLKPLLVTSRHYSPIEPPRWSVFLIGNLAKRILEGTDWGGRLGWGNVLYVYAQTAGKKRP